MLHNRKRWWLVALLAAATVWCFVDVRQRGYLYPKCPEEHRTDLDVYTAAGRAFFDGGRPYEVANPRGWTYLYPPMLALMLAPLDVLPTQDQVTVWFFISLVFCWGCWCECRRIVTIVCDEDPVVAAAWARWSPWLAVAAVTAALIPTLNCLQRGQVSILKLYFLLLGLRLILGGRTYRAWLAGGVALALPIVLKILPVVQVGFLVLLLLLDLAARHWKRRPPTARTGRTAFHGIDLGSRPGIGPIHSVHSLAAPRLAGQYAPLGYVGAVHADQGRRRRHGSPLRQFPYHAQSEFAQRRLSAGQFRGLCFRRRPRRSRGGRVERAPKWRWTPPRPKGF